MKLTRKQAIMWHRDMWNDMADEIERCKAIINVCEFKHQYCSSNNFVSIDEYCFLCEYANCNCSKCPLQWESEVEEFMCANKYQYGDREGLWLRCKDSTDWKEQAALARQIANLPEREKN